MKRRPRDRSQDGTPTTISIVAPGMQVLGDCVTDGTLRIEGHVVGSVYAAKAVVVGQAGVVEGDIRTQDAVIAGAVIGTLLAASRLEVQDGARIEGEVHARRLQLDEGAVLNGEIRMGEVDTGPPPGVSAAPGEDEDPALDVAPTHLPEVAGSR